MLDQVHDDDVEAFGAPVVEIPDRIVVAEVGDQRPGGIALHQEWPTVGIEQPATVGGNLQGIAGDGRRLRQRLGSRTAGRGRMRRVMAMYLWRARLAHDSFPTTAVPPASNSRSRGGGRRTKMRSPSRIGVAASMRMLSAAPSARC